MLNIKEKSINDHIGKALQLAGSLVIKNTDTVELMNRDFIAKYGEAAALGSGESDWRYYKHLNGELHPNDTSISIKSLEDQTVIPFTKTALSTRQVTRDAYRYGKPQFLNLVAQYKDYENYIKGVVYPVDPSISIPAEDGTILAWDTEYIDRNKEWFILEDLQEWIYNWLSRWDNKAFKITDDLFPAAKHGILSLYLPAKILEIRLRRADPVFSSSFYQELSISSWYNITTVPGSIPEYSKKWLSRNAYVNTAKKGQNITLDKVIDNVGNRAYISMSRLDRYQNSNNILKRPEILFKNTDTIQSNVLDTTKRYTEDEILALEAPLTYYNTTYGIFYKYPMLNMTRFSRTATGALISDIVDKTSSVPHHRSSVLIDMLGYMIQGEYNAIHIYKNPENNVKYSVNTRDLFYIYIWYIIKKQGGDPNTIPVWKFVHIPIDTDASTVLSNKPTDVRIDDKVNDYDSNHSKIETTNSASGYKKLATKVYRSNIKYWLTISNTGSKIESGVLRNLWYRFYGHGDRPSSGAATYAAFSSSLNITFPTNPDKETIDKTISEIEETLFEGYDREVLKEIQSFLKQTLNNKISYTSQFLTNIQTLNRLYGRILIPRIDFGKISQHYAVHGVLSEPPHEDIYATGDWFTVSFDQLTTTEQAQIKDIYNN